MYIRVSTVSSFTVRYLWTFTYFFLRLSLFYVWSFSFIFHFFLSLSGYFDCTREAKENKQIVSRIWERIGRVQLVDYFAESIWPGPLWIFIFRFLYSFYSFFVSNIFFSVFLSIIFFLLLRLCFVAFIRYVLRVPGAVCVFVVNISVLVFFFSRVFSASYAKCCDCRSTRALLRNEKWGNF